MATTVVNLREAMTVDLPEGELDGLRIDRFEIGKHDINNLREALRCGRGTRPGTYTRLTLNGRLWMSDTDAEKRDHLVPLTLIRQREARRVLVNGLGLGMVVKAALALPHVEHIDVVECDERVVKLVGPHYEATGRVTVHHADAYEQARRWPSGTRWDVGWSDIWPDLRTDNLTEMARLNRSYGRRCDWHGCWGQGLLRYQRRVEARQGW